MMLKKIVSAFSCVSLFGIIACSENTAGVTEEENPGLAFEVKEPTSYDLWTFDSQSGNKNSGYWFDLDDASESDATITLPAPLGDGSSERAMKAVVDACGGICGTVEFAESSKPLLSAGIGFSLGKENSTVDASSWNGLCVTYESELDMRLKFSLGKDDANVDSDMPFAEFPKVSKVGTRCAKWENFKQNRLNNITGEEAAKKLGAVLFEFVGKSKQKGSFNIKGLGSYKDVESQQNGEKKPLSSSSTGEMCSYEPVHDLWYGPDHMGQVETELSNETESNGYWFDFIDSTQNAMLMWPVSKGNDYSIESLDPIIESCDGLCARVSFIDKCSVGVGFHIVGETSVTENEPAFGDAEDWGGLCVTYSSELGMDVVMSTANESIISQASNMPRVSLPSSVDVTTQCMKWSDFKNPDGELGDASKFRSLLFFINGDRGIESEFKLVALGRFSSLSDASCKINWSSSSKNTVSSSSRSHSSSSADSDSIRLFKGNEGYEDVCSFSSVNDLWYGIDRIPYVNTGLANETETAGYWYNFGYMSDAGEGTVFTWPTALGNEYDDLALDSVVDFCAGVCAEMYYKMDAFSGVAFNVVGAISITDNSLSAGDASSWGGLCVTYAADADMDVVMISSLEGDNAGKIPLQPKVTLPKSIDVTTKCMEWSDFVSSDGKTSGDASALTTLLFGFYGSGGQYIRFNIMGLGQYHRLSNPECTAKEHFVSGE